MKSLAFLVALILGSGCAYGATSDSSLLGFYVGGSVGRSDVRAGTWEPPSFEVPGFDEHATGWKVLVGVRPVRLLAAELSYIDFGHPNGAANAGFYTWHSNVLQRAPTLSGLLYLPIPIPILGVYARAGIARLESSGSSYSTCSSGPCPNIIIPPYRINSTHTDFLYGAGLQVSLSALSIRLEYERINASVGNPDLLSAGLTWAF
jgi:OmpA-like transmembrane domain